jgi:hypothetical protein
VEFTLKNHKVSNMHPDVALGISVELQTVLPGDWKVREVSDHFILTPPKSTEPFPKNWQILSEEVWKIARFVGYPNFCSVQKTDDGGAIIESRMKSGEGFKIIVEPN